ESRDAACRQGHAPSAAHARHPEAAPQGGRQARARIHPGRAPRAGRERGRLHYRAPQGARGGVHGARVPGLQGRVRGAGAAARHGRRHRPGRAVRAGRPPDHLRGHAVRRGPVAGEAPAGGRGGGDLGQGGGGLPALRRDRDGRERLHAEDHREAERAGEQAGQHRPLLHPRLEAALRGDPPRDVRGSGPWRRILPHGRLPVHGGPRRQAACGSRRGVVRRRQAGHAAGDQPPRPGHHPRPLPRRRPRRHGARARPRRGGRHPGERRDRPQRHPLRRRHRARQQAPRHHRGRESRDRRKQSPRLPDRPRGEGERREGPGGPGRSLGRDDEV
ncbi:MAG: Glucose-1-phosphate thymidylyltransferase, partial [uncultured Gemmatimonadetes bacterium]